MERNVKMVAWVEPYLASLPETDWLTLSAADRDLDVRCTEFLDIYGLDLETLTTRHGFVEEMVSLPALCKAIRHCPSVLDGCEVRESVQEPHKSPWGGPLSETRYIVRRHIPMYVNCQWTNLCDLTRTSEQLACERELVGASRSFQVLQNNIAKKNPPDAETDKILLQNDVRYEYDRAIDKVYGSPSKSVEGEQRMRNRMHAAWDIGGIPCVIQTMRDCDIPVSPLLHTYAIDEPAWIPTTRRVEVQNPPYLPGEGR